MFIGYVLQSRAARPGAVLFDFFMGRYWLYCVVKLLLLSILLLGKQVYGQRNSARYNWQNVKINGGGFVSGIIFHPKAKDVRYCRTDMGGAYRWNERAKTWEPLLDWLSYQDRNLMGVESIALDPEDENRLYLACGTYTNNEPRAILLSDDRGKTFKRINVPFQFGGNENGRGNGERMMVDPNNSNILFIGTRKDGLWKSEDRGFSWKRINSFPDTEEGYPDNLPKEQQRRYAWQNHGCGIVFVIADPRSGTKKKGSNVLYAGASLKDRNNLYMSSDAGKTWQPVKDHPTRNRPTHAVLANDGNLYITYGSNPGPNPMVDGEVWKFNTNTSEWKEITPDKVDPEKNRTFGYAAVAVDANDPEKLIVSSYNRYQAGGEEIFRSTDGGVNWKPVLRRSVFDNSAAPYVAPTGVHWLFDIEIDPFNPDHAMFTTGYGGHETYNLSALDSGKKVNWTVMSDGIEETVALDLLSPAQGAPLISAIGDYGGFFHEDLKQVAAAGNFMNPHFGNTNSIAAAEANPQLVVRVGIASHQIAGNNIGFSTDGGKTWRPCSMPSSESKNGHIALSADGSTWIWTPERSASWLSTDSGSSWKSVVGLPENVPAVADKVNSARFYAADLFKGKFYASSDGGKTFSETTLDPAIKIVFPKNKRGDVRGGQDHLYATPGKEGSLWIPAFDGLYYSKNAGRNFQKLPLANEIHAFGFGKGISADPALYLVGVVDKVRGVFRSDNLGKSWTRINDDKNQWGMILQVTGDPKQYGRVYIGTHGRGIIYGDPK